MLVISSCKYLCCNVWRSAFEFSSGFFVLPVLSTVEVPNNWYLQNNQIPRLIKDYIHWEYQWFWSRIQLCFSEGLINWLCFHDSGLVPKLLTAKKHQWSKFTLMELLPSYIYYCRSILLHLLHLYILEKQELGNCLLFSWIKFASVYIMNLHKWFVLNTKYFGI